MTKDSYIQTQSHHAPTSKPSTSLPKVLKPQVLKSKISKRSQSVQREQPGHLVEEAINFAKKATALVEDQRDDKDKDGQ